MPDRKVIVTVLKRRTGPGQFTLEIDPNKMKILDQDHNLYGVDTCINEEGKEVLVKDVLKEWDVQRQNMKLENQSIPKEN